MGEILEMLKKAEEGNPYGSDLPDGDIIKRITFVKDTEKAKYNLKGNRHEDMRFYEAGA